MAKYEVNLTEEWYGRWNIEASSKEEAKDKFMDMIARGEIDLLREMDLVDSTTGVYEIVQ